MHLDYQITEGDFVYGEVQVFRAKPNRKDTLRILGIPLTGLLFIVWAGWNFLRSGFAAVQVFVALLGLCGLFVVPLVNSWLSRRIRQHARIIYRSTAWLRGRLFLEVNEEGIQFAGDGLSMKTRWAEFTDFFEDRRTFILHQRNPQSPPPLIFHIVPKHNLSPDQIETFRRSVQSKIGKKRRSR